MVGGGSSPSDVDAAAELRRAGHAEQLISDIRSANTRRSIRFRAIFIATWVVVIGGLVMALMAGPRFDPAFLLQPVDARVPGSLPRWVYILGGVPTTLFVSVASIALAVVLAGLGALGRLAGSAVVYATASLYVSLVRGTPLIVQVFFVYLALPQIIPAAGGVPLIVLGIFALGFNYGAYMTEIFRAGIQAVPRGQREAAEALAMPEGLVMRRIVMPQAVRIVVPAIGNEFIAMTKDSALVSFIGVQELLWRAQRIGSANFRNMETLLLAALVYWALTMLFTVFQERLERRLARGDR